jgi:hypothetical protein
MITLSKKLNMMMNSKKMKRLSDIISALESVESSEIQE